MAAVSRMDFPMSVIMDASLNPMFVNCFWQQCIISILDALGHLAGLLCIKFREEILIINISQPILLELAELADSLIYLPTSMDLLRNTNCRMVHPSFHGFHRRKCKIPSIYNIFEKHDQWCSENKYVSKITQQFIYFKIKIVRK
jgi:hypothetical protein